MPRTFITFLGTTVYHLGSYFMPSRPELASLESYYVQEFLLGNVFTPAQPDDQVIVCTTEAAHHANYLRRVQTYFPKAGFDSDGLQARLQRLQESAAIGHFEALKIPNGDDEEEIWQIFDTIFKAIRPCDDVYLDITNSFRFLPMLTLPLLNYAAVLKKSIIKGIYYGNFEVGQNQKRAALAEARERGASEEELDQIKNQVTQAPVFDLLPISILQDWSIAADDFLLAGDTSRLESLMVAQQPQLANQLSQFSQAIASCRGNALIQHLDIDGLKQEADFPDLQQISSQLRPLIQEINRKLEPFETGNARNGLQAVAWCIEHGQIQQGFTFLQESILTILVTECGGDPSNKLQREWAAGAVLGKTNPRSLGVKRNPQHPFEMTLCQKFIDWAGQYPGLKRPYHSMTGSTGARNDINHAGFGTAPKTADQLKDMLQTLFQQVLLAFERPAQ